MTTDHGTLTQHPEDPYGWNEYWFCLLRTLPGARGGFQLLSKDPQLVVTPTGKRVFRDSDILYKAKLTPQEVALGFSKLCILYGQGIMPGSSELLKRINSEGEAA